jgi:lysophospholipase L1-like esterase
MGFIGANDIVLFQGDSITDAGRDRDNLQSLGRGYANLVASWYGALYPEQGVQFLNRGVSGDRVRDLEVRWDQDCLELQPTVLSIMIGINDCWRRFSRNDPTSTEEYATGYTRLLTRVRRETSARLILMEPFLVPVNPDLKAWREDLDPKIQAVRELARDFDALYVPLDGLFAQASTRQKPSYWAPDGVHPSSGGHGLIAQAWLRTIGVEL